MERDPKQPSVRDVFGERAGFYTTSATHTEEAVLSRVVSLAQPTVEMLALDVGTGTGHTAFALAPHVGWVVGADITPEMLREARGLQARHGIANADFCLADAAALPFPAACFGVVTCRRAAHHFTSIRRALCEMRRVLRPGGRLVVDDRSVPEDDFVDELMNRLDVLHDPSHVREHRPSEWEQLLAEAGFSVEVVDPYTRHRPLSSLTAGIPAEHAAEIRSLIAALDDGQRAAMNVVDRDGEVYTDHWFVTVAAVKSG